MHTLKDCETLVNNTKFFTKTTNYIDGYEIISFNYQDGTHYNDFLTHDGFHMRGLTFVEGVKFPMLDKFFNLGERHVDEINEAKSKKIKSIQKKDDGSLIGFIVLPNGRVIAKTKVGLDNEFTKIANNWLLEDNNETKIKKLFKEGVFPLFECVSNNFPVVLKYDWEGLVLIQSRKNDLSFLEMEELERIAKEHNWHFEKPLAHTLEELLDLKDTVEDIEGFIVRFEDDTFTKIKTSWYFEKHASDEGLTRMNTIIKTHLNGEKESLEEYEKAFLKELQQKVLDPHSIDSIEKLKTWVFRDGDVKEVNRYKQLYKGFLKEYSLMNNYENENTLIKLYLNNSTDDILPNLDDCQRAKLFTIEEVVGDFIRTNTKKISRALERNLEAKKINEEFKGYQYIGLIFKFSKKEWNTKEIVEDLIKDVLKKTKNKREAIKWLEENTKETA
jgi:hypothetical protein